jgi:hypothetical protein
MEPFTAYFDDSGTHAQANVAVAACFISTVDKWIQLERLWNETNEKEKFGIFHMADFVARTKQFKNWEDSKRERVIRELIRIIKTNVYVSVMGAVIKVDYDAEVTGDARRYLGQTHYSFNVRSCLNFIRQWREKNNFTNPIHYVFAAGSKGNGELNDLFISAVGPENRADAYLKVGIKKNGWTFARKEDAVALQSADILAWETYKHMKDSVLARNKKQMRASFKSMVEAPSMNRFFNKKTLREIVEKARSRGYCE